MITGIMFNRTMITCMLALLLKLPAPVVNDDRDVIQTAMLSYFTKLKPGDFGPKHHVVLRTQFVSKDRAEFPMAHKGIRSSLQSQLGSLTKSLKYDNDVRADRKLEDRASAESVNRELEALALVKGNFGGSDYGPPPLIPLKSMGWDERVKVTDRSNDGRVEEKNRDKSLEPDTVYAQATRPSYSRNGRYAIVSLWIPCYIHMACNTFLFERRVGGWSQLVVSLDVQL